MGFDKAFLEFHGIALYERALRVFEQFGVPGAVIAGPGHRFPQRVRVVEDLWPGRGPLAAVATALTQVSDCHHFFLPCDTPLADDRVLACLDAHRPGCELLMFSDSSGRIHPLPGYYGTACLAPALRLLEAGRRSLQSLLEAGMRSRILSPADHHLPDAVFLNLNSPEDLARIEGRWAPPAGAR